MEIKELIIEIIESGREATDDEIQRIREHVAGVGFEPGGWTKAGIHIHGLLWNGQIIHSNDRMSNLIAHFLRHTVAQQEWPTGTTLDEYIASLRRAVEDPEGGIALEKRFHQWQLSFIADARESQGLKSRGWILVGYPVEYGYWATGFQPDLGLHHFTLDVTEGERWLREPSDTKRLISS